MKVAEHLGLSTEKSTKNCRAHGHGRPAFTQYRALTILARVRLNSRESLAFVCTNPTWRFPFFFVYKQRRKLCYTWIHLMACFTQYRALTISARVRQKIAGKVWLLPVQTLPGTFRSSSTNKDGSLLHVDTSHSLLQLRE